MIIGLERRYMLEVTLAVVFLQRFIYHVMFNG